MDNTGWNRLAFLLLAALSACGGDDDGKPGSKSSTGRFGSVPRLGMSTNMGGMMPMTSMRMMTGRMCTAPANPTTCEACVIGNCRGSCDACAADSSCPPALECIADCDDDACIEGCGDPAAVDKVIAFAECIQDSCDTPCGVTQSSGAPSACDACAQTQCRRLNDACTRDPDCLELVNCCSEGSEPECDACVETAPSSAVMTLTEFGQCLSACGCG